MAGQSVTMVVEETGCSSSSASRITGLSSPSSASRVTGFASSSSSSTIRITNYSSSSAGKVTEERGSTSFTELQITPEVDDEVQTSKTSQDTKKRSHASRHLRMVLKEVNKNLPKNDQLDRRLQLPYFAMGYFNDSGGSLSLDEYGVQLTIPRGAIAPGSPQQVYIYVDPTAPPNDVVELTEVALSPSVECGPEGLRFKESVVLSFPHHSVLKGQRYDKLVVRMHHDDSQEGQWEDGNPGLVTEKEVFVSVNHFTGFTMVGAPRPGSSKRLKVGAFGGHLDKRRGQHTFRVHVWNDEESVEKSVLREEKRMKSEMLDVFRKLQFFWDSGDLAVGVTNLDSGWAIREGPEQTIYKDQIRHQEENSVTFNLKRQMGDSEDEGLYCAVRTYQLSPNEDLRRQTEVRLNFYLKKKKMSLWERIVRRFTGARQQTPGSKTTQSTENNIRCVCYQTGDLCGYCKAQIGKEWSNKVLGEVHPQDYGGLSQGAVNALCVLLDAGNNWTKLLEKMTIVEGTVVRNVVKRNKFHTKTLLNVYFVCSRRSNKTPEHAKEFLIKLLNEIGFTGAVEIIQNDHSGRDE